jgi:HD-GYP domain-containing protein (c-di-GMP phosphodiesterase class II)
MSKRLPHAMVIDSNVAQRHQVIVALAALYQVQGFPDVQTAIAMTRKAPAVVIVDEAGKAHDRRDVVRCLRAEHHYRESRIVLCRPKRRMSDNINHYLDSQPDFVLEKPYRRSDLINAVSGVANRKIEAGWETLPKRAKDALKGSLKFYDGLQGLLCQGEMLDIKQLSSVAAPIIDSIQKQDHKVLLEAVREHDNLSYVHMVRVSTLLTLFGRTIGLSGDKLEILTCGALVHDIGKSTIPEELHHKVEPLTPEEMEMMRGHVKAGTDFLRKNSNLSKGIITIAECHHERLDGSGYPNKLRGGEINDLARMAAIVDVFVGLTDRRPYRVPKDVDTALRIMTEDMTGQLDQWLLKLLSEVLRDATAHDWT